MFGDLVEFYNLSSVILFKGGWVFFAMALVYIFYRLYMDFINIRWYKEQRWVFLKIAAPLDNEKSPLTFEHIFNQLHALHATFTFPEKYIEGQFQIWLTWELTSIGGAIGNYVRILEKHRDTLEAAIYSQFPNAEITEAEDYFQLLPKYHPDHSEYAIFAYDMVAKKPEHGYPIRTYLDYEHASADTIVDPVTGMWEELGKLSPHEMFVMQYVVRPVDDSWKKKARDLVSELKGEPEEHAERGIIATVLHGILDVFFEVAIRPTPVENGGRPQEEPPSLMLHRTETEKEVIAAVEKKLSRLSFATKIRCVYIAPREKFNPSPAYTAHIGAVKALSSTILNSIKPDTDTWTKVKYWMFKDWERPILEIRRKYRERHFMHMIVDRWYFWGPPAYIMSTEELATLIHFPSIEVKVPQIEKVTATKVQPPPELPIAVDI